MVRYFIGLALFVVIAGAAIAQNLEEQFSLWAADEKDKITCFDARSDFQYCLRELPNKGVVVVDQGGLEVYQLYYFDNWPDEPQDGVYRIRKENKIGFADALTGKIVIEAIYDCAYPFNGGKVKVGVGCETQTDGEHSWWVGGEWITISR